jgi:hypothetical protein
MTQAMVGLVLTATFVACFAAVLGLMAEIARDVPQGGHVAVGSGYVPAPIPRSPRYVGRHRR